MGLNNAYPLGPTAADLIKDDFDTLINQKGRAVIVETALQCPCKDLKSNQQSTCKNCGGTGWIFINPRQTRMILSAVNIVTEYRPWSEELRGTVNITCRAEERLSNMDRITALDGEAIFNEVLYLRKKDDVIFAYTTYNVKEVFYAGLYRGEGVALQRLIEGVDFIVENSIIRIINVDIISAYQKDSLSFTIRYKHAPQFHVIEMRRETMETFEWQDSEKLRHLPLSAIGRRAHYQLSAQNLAGDRLINNSYEDC